MRVFMGQRPVRWTNKQKKRAIAYKVQGKYNTDNKVTSRPEDSTLEPVTHRTTQARSRRSNLLSL